MAATNRDEGRLLFVHVLHAIHDFPPRHVAGSELHALALAREQSVRHDVTVLCAAYDPSRAHGHVTWRVQQGVPVVEIVNNWKCATFEETYRAPLILDRIRHVLRTIRPDVVHVHSLLNLSFDLPSVAKDLGIPVVATLHDYSLVCASGGQLVHQAERHVCRNIDSARCARCFTASPFYAQTALAGMTKGPAGDILNRAAVAVRRALPSVAVRASQAARYVGMRVSPQDLERRLRAARDVFHEIDLFVSPSAPLARDFERFGLPPERLRVSDYGMPALARVPRRAAGQPIVFGFVGMLVWHKGAHVLIEAAKTLPAGTFEVKIFGSAGTFPDYVGGLRKAADALPVSFMGAFPPDQAAAVYGQMDVLVVPSIWPENSPIVIHEAFQAGVPVVGARTGGIPELIDDGVSGYTYDPSSPQDLARILRALIDDPARVRALSAGVPPVKTMSRHACEWDAFYAEACALRAARTA